MEEEIRRLEKRAYQSWENDFAKNLMLSNKLIRIGVATFTMAKAKHRVPKTFQIIIDDYFNALAKRQKRHFVWLFGQTPIGAEEKTHQHGDIFLVYKEGVIRDADTYRMLLEASFKFGRCEVVNKEKVFDEETGLYTNKGNWTGYSVAKHDGNDNFLKVYCPKIGDCGRHTRKKGDKRFCVYQRDAIKLK